MEVMLERYDLNHPAWLTGLATVIGYVGIVAVLFVGLFVIPYLVFFAL